MYPPPHMEDLSAQLASKKVSSKLDLCKGYYQVQVAQQDVLKTAVINSFRLYKLLRAPCSSLPAPLPVPCLSPACS